MKDGEALQEHMMDEHEQIVILHTMASQVNDIHEKQEKNESFQTDLFSVLRSIYERVSALENKILEKEAKISVLENKIVEKEAKLKKSIPRSMMKIKKKWSQMSEMYKK